VTRFDHRGESPWKRAGTAAGAEGNPRPKISEKTDAKRVSVA
jgi:hypothetical protein